MDKQIKEKTAKERIDEMVKEYNENEAEQEKRLRDLFYAIKKRKSYRRILFSSGNVLSNCWDSPDRFDNKLHLNNYVRQIVQADIGED
jgi:hypothetical protein